MSASDRGLQISLVAAAQATMLRVRVLGLNPHCLPIQSSRSATLKSNPKPFSIIAGHYPADTKQQLP